LFYIGLSMSLQDALIIVLIASVMLSMGLSLKPQQLWQALQRPRPLLMILGINLVALPLLAILLAPLLSAEMALALLLAGAWGVGSTAPLFTANVRGNIALATAALVISGFICLLTLPLTLALAGFELQGFTASVSAIAWQAFVTMLLWQVLPLLLGMLCHYYWPARAEYWAARFKWLGNVTLGVLIVGITATQGHLMLAIPALEWAVLLLLVAATYLVPLFWQQQSWGTALLFCSCTRNLNLALLLASQVFVSNGLILAILSYAFVMYLLLLPFTLWLRKNAKPMGTASASV
jgi:BASS family bile acid:Na+ symporter